jgi:cytochrome c biogenesis protein CcmG, thiol:disulfide interchange protein DsbE
MRRLAAVAGLVAAVLFVALLGYGLAARSPDRSIDDSLADGKAPAAPQFDLDVLQRGEFGVGAGELTAALGDGRVRLAELRGVAVVLNFWASWCDPCRVEAPVLAAGWRRFRADGVVFVGLDMQDDPGDARRFLSEQRITYLNVRDRGNAVSRRYGLTGIPETYFIDARGRVVAHVIGAIDRQGLDRGVKAAVSGAPEDAQRGGARNPTR